MPVFSTCNDIQKAIQVFNKQAYNAGFEFKVYSSEESCLYIQASFDFAYYVDVDIECREVFYTNIDSKASWPDAWYADQLFLLTEEELKEIIGKENYFINGTVICSSLYINWRRAEKNEAFV